jgi:hypothetical protein
MGISDNVAGDHLTPEQRAERGSYTGCIAGALSMAEFRSGLEAAGLEDVSITPSHTVADGMVSAIIKATKPIDDGSEQVAVPAAGTTRDLPIASGCCGGDGCC